jgi:outer membrane receptor protein involved in Fe transport
MNKKRISQAIHMILFSSTLTLSSVANAKAESEQQDASADESQQTQSQSESSAKSDGAIEKISVTGSRIKRDSFSLSTPLTVVDRDLIEDIGLGAIADILVEEVPALSASSSTTNSQSSISNSGLSTVNLRNLGSNRTLVLIDGRRTVSNSTSSNSVSLGTIPAGFIRNTEIINGGASSIYGSDAIAGVVNIITEDSKEGFTFEARGGRTTEGAGEEFTLRSDYGTTYSDGRGYLFFAGSLDREFGIRTTDRVGAGALIPARFEYEDDPDEAFFGRNIVETANGDRLLSETPPELFSSLSSTIPGGQFEGGDFYFDENGLQTDFVTDRDGFDIRPFELLDSPRDRFNFAVKTTYDLTDSTVFDAQLQFSETETSVVRLPEGLRSGQDINVIGPVTGEISQIEPNRIAIDNPFVPQVIADNAGNDIDFRRRFIELGQVSRENTRRTYRGWAGLKGSLFNDEWEWDASVGYGRYTQSQVRTNEINVFRINNALDAEFGPDGEIRCSSEEARADGCVPLNIFGVGTVTPEAADYIRANPIINAELEQFNFLAFTSGDLLDLPAGPLGAAFGVEYRKDKLERGVDELSQFGGVTNNLTPAFSGDIDVYEVFSEFYIPLVKDKPWAKNLSTEASVRVADYSQANVGVVASYKAGVVWEVAEGYLFRANYALSQRAPDINEVFSPPAGDFDNVTDICDGVTLTSVGTLDDNCRAEPGIVLGIIDNDDGEFDGSGSIHSPNGGNLNLKEESGKSLFAGVVLSPSFIDDLNIAIDYYDIKIEDAISQIGNEEILRECYNSATPFGEDNIFCQRVDRSLSTGEISTLLQTSENLNENRARGVDVAFEYGYDLDAYGSLSLRVSYNRVIENSQTFDTENGLRTTQFAGELESDIFDNRATSSLIWSYNDLRVRWSTRFRGTTIDSFERLDDFRELQAEFPDADLETPVGLFIPSFITHNLSVSYKIELDNGYDIRLRGGANNIFNNLGPFLAASGDIESGERGNTNPNFGGLRGRFVFLGAELRF